MDGGIFDQFTGATITPRSIVKAVKNTLIFYREHGDTLFQKEGERTPAEKQEIKAAAVAG